MTTQVGPGLAKPELQRERLARATNEERVSGFHRGQQRMLRKAAYKAATYPVEAEHKKT